MWKDYLMDYSNTYKWMDKITKMPPLIITVAVNGGVQGKEMHSLLPERSDEIAEEAYKAYNAGASIVHIHGRDPECLWKTTDKTEVYRDINRKVREKCPDIIVNNSTGASDSNLDGRLQRIDALPEIASLNMGPEMVRFQMPPRTGVEHCHNGYLDDNCSGTTYGYLEGLAKGMLERNVKPEMELYHGGQYWVSQELIKKGILKPPYYFQFVMGYQTSLYPTPENLIQLVKELPENSVFSGIGIGKFQWTMTAMSIILGGNVRVGLEDNLYLKRGEKLKDNAAAVDRIVQLAKYFHREVATPAQAREILGLDPNPRQWK